METTMHREDKAMLTITIATLILGWIAASTIGTVAYFQGQ